MKIEMVTAAVVDGMLLHPLCCDSGVWEWMLPESGDPDEPHYLTPELFRNLPGYNPKRFCVAYPTINDAFSALHEAVYRINAKDEP